MSISDLIIKAEQNGQLLRYIPRALRGCKRAAFLSKEAYNDINKELSAASLLGGTGYIHAALTKWVNGEYIYKGFIKRLAKPPPDIWEIKVTEPNPQWRIFFRFADKDTIIISKCYSRNTLKDKNSQAWKEAMNGCETFWNNIFGNISPFVNEDRSINYVSDKCDDFKV